MAFAQRNSAAGPGKPKYEKLVKGERKAVRQVGAKKDAKSGTISEIYSAQKGGGLTIANKSDKGLSKSNQGAITLQGRTAEVKLKSKPGTQEEKAATFERQAQINQGDFEKTRLGARIVRKAKKKAAEAGTSVKRSAGVTKK